MNFAGLEGHSFNFKQMYFSSFTVTQKNALPGSPLNLRLKEGIFNTCTEWKRKHFFTRQIIIETCLCAVLARDQCAMLEHIVAAILPCGHIKWSNTSKGGSNTQLQYSMDSASPVPRD